MRLTCQNYRNAILALSGLVLLVIMWVWVGIVATQIPNGAFAIAEFVGNHTLGFTVTALATTIVGYFNSWWGAAIATATLALIGLGWAAAFIETMLAEYGFSQAVQYASML